MSQSNRTAFQIAMETSPIILTRGLATAQGGAVPIVQYTTPNLNVTATAAGQVTASLAPATPTLNIGLSLKGISASVGSNATNLDNVFARYSLAPGSVLLTNAIGQYPFANQAIAANAIIAQPCNFSMIMDCPAGNAGTYQQKQTTLTALQKTLAQHNGMGGTYTVVTPGFIYLDCVMLMFQNVDGGDSKQVQYRYRMDFYQPLISLAAAQNALNVLTNKLSNGTPVAGSATAATGLPVNNPLVTVSSSFPSLLQLVQQNVHTPFSGNYGF